MSRILEHRNKIMERINNGENFRSIMKKEYSSEDIYIIRMVDGKDQVYTKDVFYNRAQALYNLQKYELLGHDYAFLLHGTIGMLEDGQLRDQVTDELLGDEEINMVYFTMREPIFRIEPPVFTGR